MGQVVEGAVGTPVARQRLPQVGRAVGRDGLRGLLALVVRARQVAVEKPGAMRPAQMTAGVGSPTYTSRLLFSAAHTTARAASSGW